MLLLVEHLQQALTSTLAELRYHNMGLSVFPAPVASSKTMFRTTLTSGTSWTVPAGVTYVNVTLLGGGGGGGGGASSSGTNPVIGQMGLPGQVVSSTLSTTPGASIAYAIGGGGSAGSATVHGGTGGTTTFTGATSAAGGGFGFSGASGAPASAGSATSIGNNGGAGGGPIYNTSGGAGGAGKIDIEYWV
jgi:hypothetical protein